MRTHKRTATTIGGFGIGLIMWVLEMADVDISTFWLIVLGCIAVGMVIYGMIPVGCIAFQFVSKVRFRNPIVIGDRAEVNDRVSKLKLVTNAILEAKKITPKNQDVKVYITESNGLKNIFAEEIRDILLKLQEDKVLNLNSFPEWLITETPLDKAKYIADIFAHLEPARNHFVISILNEKGLKKLL